MCAFSGRETPQARSPEPAQQQPHTQTAQKATTQQCKLLIKKILLGRVINDAKTFKFKFKFKFKFEFKFNSNDACPQDELVRRRKNPRLAEVEVIKSFPHYPLFVE